MILMIQTLCFRRFSGQSAITAGFLLFAIFFSCMGCSKQPKGFPATIPCTIVVMKGGSPVSGATVQLIPKIESSGWIVGGDTDSQGVVALRTQQLDFASPGAPEGTYTVIITKMVTVEGEVSLEERSKMTMDEKAAYVAKINELRKKAVPIVPSALTRPTSPLVFDVSKTANNFTVELDDYK